MIITLQFTDTARNLQCGREIKKEITCDTRWIRFAYEEQDPKDLGFEFNKEHGCSEYSMDILPLNDCGDYSFGLTKDDYERIKKQLLETNPERCYNEKKNQKV